MKSKSSRVVKSVTVVTRPQETPVMGSLASQPSIVHLIGADVVATNIGIALVRSGVSILRIYDPNAKAMAKRLAKEPGYRQTWIIGCPFRFGPVEASFFCDVAVVVNPDPALLAFCNDQFYNTQTPFVVARMMRNQEVGQVSVHLPQMGWVDIRTCAFHGAAQVAATVSEVVESLVLTCELEWSSATAGRPVILDGPEHRQYDQPQRPALLQEVIASARS
jgi:hypothetical protein